MRFFLIASTFPVWLAWWACRQGMHLEVLQSEHTGDDISKEGQAPLQFTISQDLKQEYSDHGYVVLRDLVPLDTVNQLLTAAKAAVSQRRARGHLSITNKAAFYSLWVENLAIRLFWAESQVARAVAEITQAEGVRMFEDATMTARLVGANSEVAFKDWHFDLGSFNLINEKDWGYSIWIAFANVSDSSGGSIAMCSKRNIPDQCRPLFGGSGPHNASMRSWCNFRLKEVCQNLTFNAGDALVFSGSSVHRSLPIRDPAFERFALVGRFVDTRATYQGSFWTSAVAYAKSYEDRAMHAICQHELVDGGFIVGACFPRLYPDPEQENLHAERLFVKRSLVAILGASFGWWHRCMSAAPYSMGLLLLLFPKMLAIFWKTFKKKSKKPSR